MHDVRIGISGWTYPPWRGVFYPEGLAHRRELEYASRALSTIEINGSFYSLQRPEVYLRWRDATPVGFVFSVKGSRYLTHLRRLHDVRMPLANFFASGVLALGPKLGPILWQFPPSMRFEPSRFEEFFSLLPSTTGEAARLAEEREPWMADRSWTDPGPRRALRHAVEPRHASFGDPAFFRLLKQYGYALVSSHSSGHWPYFERLTADFAYVRLHGEGELYSGGYDKKQLDEWERKVRAWRRTRDVFVYFDNDAKVRAPFDAMELSRWLGVFPAGALETPLAA